MSKTFSLEDVAEHNSGKSLWIVVHNKVYDVSNYLEEHPGGGEVLKECAGADATVAFEDVGHSDGAINMLEDMLIGELADEHRQDEVKVYRPTYEKIAAAPILRTQPSFWSIASWVAGVAVVGAAGSGLYFLGVSSIRDAPAMKAQLKSLLRGGYKQHSTGQFVLGYLSAGATFSTAAYIAGGKCLKMLDVSRGIGKTPPRIHQTSRVLIKKQIVTLPQRPVLDPRKYRKLPLALKEKLSANTYRFVFSLPSADAVLGLPTGQHVAIQAEVGGKIISRSYTPISNDKDPGGLELVIKIYPDGLLTNHMAGLKVGETLEFRGPKGAMTYKNGLCKHIGMITGGTGITPMYQLIRAICEDDADKTTVSLLYANNSEDDILLRPQLDSWAAKYPHKFKVWYVVGTAPAGWKYGTGFVTKEVIAERLPKSSPDSKIMLCGPPGMINAMKNNLDGLGFTKPGAIAKATDQIFLF
ncbi:hypothetical protein V502_05623 [Pseudogymnoascus sp. VKM F-4520 (FW-2644)]|nr:hypothetical protein V502_05623 [Pseudogymnoascus sp. VKM F-4520 (FW-2644)]